MRRPSLSVAALGCLLVAVGAAADADLAETRKLDREFEVGQGKRLVIDNVWGSIRVEGGSGDRIRMQVTETIQAEDSEALERAQGEVELLVEASSDLVDLYVDGPFRERNRRGGWSERWRPHYQVTYDFVVQVPAGTEIDIRTVTEGEIEIDGVHGDFAVANVNGGIDMRGLRGSGTVVTVNGPINVDFSRSPRQESKFKTVNGDVEVSFPPDLSADLELLTRWGELWTEFDIETLPVPPTTRKTSSGKTVIKGGGPLLRVAGGGPRISFETLNGDVVIRKTD